ncbi:hypothetical protein FRB95_009823 [Tulasnella sp. JGI-2019a]|nr:hypothetical protein FRB93_000792 [Tulasnella sp. JGI-2019a]KAG9025734.1 hypothetical protein FRB95_009823 [Tulasnella sp. JGI-2019a]
MEMHSDRVEKLLNWCSQNNIKIDSRLRLHDGESEADDLADAEGAIQGIAVFSNTSIPPSTSLVQIPKSSILSIKSCSLSNVFRSIHEGMEDHPSITFALALLTEIKLAARSRWYGYIQSLPVSVVKIAAFWETDGGSDGGRAQRWCKGTEVEKILLRERMESSLRSFWTDVAQPILSSVNLKAEYADMRHAYSLVSSRAFYVDSYHGISMVPIADAFNHVEENQIHLETDYDVCSTCGSLDVCEHDEEQHADDPDQQSRQETPNWKSRVQHRFTDELDMCEMVTNTPIEPGNEVFNSYDANLSNAQLLCHYGFLLEGNSNDIVTWSMDEIVQVLNGDQYSPFVASIRMCALAVSSHHLSVLYDPPSSEKQAQLVFGVDAEGSVSTHMFGLLLVENLIRRQEEGELTHYVDLLPGICADACNLLKYFLDDEDCDPMVPNKLRGFSGDSQTLDVFPILRDICVAMQNLCEEKAFGIGLDPNELEGRDWGEVLDATPRTDSATRMAITYAVSERSMLESCKMAWEELSARLAGA